MPTEIEFEMAEFLIEMSKLNREIARVQFEMHGRLASIEARLDTVEKALLADQQLPDAQP